VSLVSLVQDGPRPVIHRDRIIEALDQVLSPEERAAFRELLPNPAFSAPAIAQALQDLGIAVNASQVNHLRRKLREGRLAFES
jgi:hypothetical protein